MHLPLKPQLKKRTTQILFHQETISLLCALNSPKEQYWFIVPISRNLDLNKQRNCLMAGIDRTNFIWWVLLKPCVSRPDHQFAKARSRHRLPVGRIQVFLSLGISDASQTRGRHPSRAREIFTASNVFIRRRNSYVKGMFVITESLLASQGYIAENFIKLGILWKYEPIIPARTR